MLGDLPVAAAGGGVLLPPPSLRQQARRQKRVLQATSSKKPLNAQAGYFLEATVAKEKKANSSGTLKS